MTTTQPTLPPSPSPAPVLLAVRGLSVSYDGAGGPVPALADVSLDLVAGAILGVIGESGSGKSTLGRAVLGMLPHAGRVTGGRAALISAEGEVDLLALRPRQLRSLRGSSVALVPQATASALHPVRRIGAQFDQTYRAHGLKDSGANRARARQALDNVGMADSDHVLEMYPHQLSGGMAQRVVVALAGALEPQVLVADEPTSALDVTVQRRLLDNLSRTIRSSGRACLLITHDLGVVANYCDRVLVMYGGCGVEVGSVSAVLEHAAHPFTARLLDTVPGRRSRSTRRTDSAGEVTATQGFPGQRCPYAAVCGTAADPRCLSGMPPWRQVGADHQVRGYCTPTSERPKEGHVVPS
jgi:oligopeptide/dipeptide ABC transporter ATP-binding protein